MRIMSKQICGFLTAGFTGVLMSAPAYAEGTEIAADSRIYLIIGIAAAVLAVVVAVICICVGRAKRRRKAELKAPEHLSEKSENNKADKILHEESADDNKAKPPIKLIIIIAAVVVIIGAVVAIALWHKRKSRTAKTAD